MSEQEAEIRPSQEIYDEDENIEMHDQLGFFGFRLLFCVVLMK